MRFHSAIFQLFPSGLPLSFHIFLVWNTAERAALVCGCIPAERGCSLRACVCGRSPVPCAVVSCWATWSQDLVTTRPDNYGLIYEQQRTMTKRRRRRRRMQRKAARKALWWICRCQSSRGVRGIYSPLPLFHSCKAAHRLRCNAEVLRLWRDFKWHLLCMIKEGSTCSRRWCGVVVNATAAWEKTASTCYLGYFCLISLKNVLLANHGPPVSHKPLSTYILTLGLSTSWPILRWEWLVTTLTGFPLMDTPPTPPPSEKDHMHTYTQSLGG